MFGRKMTARQTGAEEMRAEAALTRLAQLEGELGQSRAAAEERDGLKARLVEWFGNAVEQSASLSELLCLMAWSNGNVRKLSGETVAISGAVEEMARTIQNIAELSGSAHRRASDARGIVNGGVEQARSAGRAMADIADAFSGLDRRMGQLGNAIETIGGFAKEIETISGQTKLLALNATIEAARAGEAGRGFAVVAAEVKQLSEATSRTTELIRGQLAGLTGVMHDMLDAMVVGGNKVRDGGQTFDRVVGGMEQIRDCVDRVTTDVSSITHMLSDQQIATDSIAKNLTEIARLAAQNETDSTAAADAIKKAEVAVSGMLDQGRAAAVEHYEVRRLRADHLLWKQHLAECLVGILKLDPNRFAADVAPLGPHFRAVTDPTVTGTPAWNALSGLAQSMGRDAVAMVRAVAGGDMGKAIEAYMAMDKASGEAQVELGRLVAGLRPAR